MSREALAILIELRELQEAVLLDVSFINLLRDVKITIDRVIDPRTGELIPSDENRVVEIVLRHVTRSVLVNDLADRMWVGEANWGLNEIAGVSLVEKEGGFAFTLEWENEQRRFSFECGQIEISFLDIDSSAQALRIFWGDDESEQGFEG